MPEDSGRETSPCHLPLCTLSLSLSLERFSHFQRQTMCSRCTHKATTNAMNKFYILQFPHKSIPCYSICSHSCSCKVQKCLLEVLSSKSTCVACVSFALKRTPNCSEKLSRQSRRAKTDVAQTHDDTIYAVRTMQQSMNALNLEITLHAKLILTHKYFSFVGRQTKWAKKCALRRHTSMHFYMGYCFRYAFSTKGTRKMEGNAHI